MTDNISKCCPIGRFLIKVDFTESCWNWVGSKTPKGYGSFWNGKRLVPAHRITYELIKGKIPDGLQLDHLCRNHACVNPAHLEAVTRKENILRGEAFSAELAKVTHCPKGHPFNEENTYYRPNGGGKNGVRNCKECRRIAVRKWYARSGRQYYGVKTQEALV